MGKSRVSVLLAGIAALALPIPSAAIAQTFGPPPEPPAFDEMVAPTLVSIGDILSFRALPEYHEPDWVTERFVETGLLPPVSARLPREPLVYKTGNMPDGIGVYGDTMRHVIGGRPEGWNYSAGQTQAGAASISACPNA
jgi:peptide/nickel transport system substrate-binding protein